MTKLLRILMGVEAFTFLVGSALHTGITIPGLTEPRIIPATVVEGLSAAALAVGAVVYRRQRGFVAAVVAHSVAIGGVLLGMAALAAGRGPSTALNTMYHRTILVALIVTGALIVIDGRTKRVVSV